MDGGKEGIFSYIDSYIRKKYKRKSEIIMKMGLRKSSTDKAITGVCGGIAEFFDISPAIVRVIFLFTFPASFTVYIILALLLE